MPVTVRPVQKLLILRGAPGSGKTTYAKTLLHTVVPTRQWKRVNRDALRDMIDDGTWSQPNEKDIVAIEERIIKHYLRGGFNVIVDDTNCNSKVVHRWKNLVANSDAVAEEFIIHPSLHVCLQQNLTRKGTPSHVPDDVVTKFWNQINDIIQSRHDLQEGEPHVEK